jgi:hypothetical protein
MLPTPNQRGRHICILTAKFLQLLSWIDLEKEGTFRVDRARAESKKT